MTTAYPHRVLRSSLTFLQSLLLPLRQTLRRSMPLSLLLGISINLPKEVIAFTLCCFDIAQYSIVTTEIPTVCTTDIAPTVTASTSQQRSNSFATSFPGSIRPFIPTQNAALASPPPGNSAHGSHSRGPRRASSRHGIQLSKYVISYIAGQCLLSVLLAVSTGLFSILRHMWKKLNKYIFLL